jgi:hypothetical protein
MDVLVVSRGWRVTIHHLNSQRRLQVLSRCEERGPGRRHTRTSATTSSLQSPLHAHSLTSCPRPILHRPPSPSSSPLLQSSVRFVMLSKATRPLSHIMWKAISPERSSSRRRNKRQAKFDGNLRQPNSGRPLATGATNAPRHLSIKPDDSFQPACCRYHALWRSSHPSLASRVTEEVCTSAAPMSDLSHSSFPMHRPAPWRTTGSSD